MCFHTAEAPGENKPKSGTMAPITQADSSRQRLNRRANGRMAAAWEMVKGMGSYFCQ